MLETTAPYEAVMSIPFSLAITDLIFDVISAAYVTIAYSRNLVSFTRNYNRAKMSHISQCIMLIQ